MNKRANLKVWAAALLAVVAAAAMVVALGFTSPAQAAFAGDLDASFDHDGRVVFDVFGGVDDRARAVAIQPDGKIVLAGWWCGFGANCNVGTFALTRFDPDGSLDSAFGSGGRALVTFPNGRAEATGVAIQPDGKIIAAGWRNDDDGVEDADFALVRLEPDGDLDPSFSGDGKQTTSFGGSDHGEAVAIQGDEKIVVAGSSWGCGGLDFALARYNTNGSLDGSFGGDGKISTGFGGDDSARGVAVQTDGRIVAAGDNGGDFALARYNTNGSLDPGFSGDGKQITNFGGDDGGEGLAIQADGKIVAAGHTDAGASGFNFALARYHSITDNTPPDTTITSGPSGTINSTSATFTFASSEPDSKFQCSLDEAPFSGCSSPKSYSNLTDGSHLFRVRAIDAAGNTDQSPAQRSFTVDAIAPKVTSIHPTENATGVAPAVNVKATFSEAMRASSITTNTVKLFRAGTTTPLAAGVSYDAERKTAILDPDANLRLGAKYKAVVTTATRDLAGNRLDQDEDPSNGNQPKVWFFTVRN